MIFKSTLKKDQSEVEELVKFGCGHISADDVAIVVKNGRGTYRGFAYRGVPSMSPFKGKATYLITLRVGRDKAFPCSNVIKNYTWVLCNPVKKVTKNHYVAEHKNIRGEVFTKTFMRKKLVSAIPYGGKKSPVITMNDWREALVCIAAHEIWHIHQYRNKLRCVESDCEKYANERLMAYRAKVAQEAPCPFDN